MNCTRTFRQLALALAVAAAMASPSFAATYNLRAGTATKSLPGSPGVTVWGFACVSTSVLGDEVARLHSKYLALAAERRR